MSASNLNAAFQFSRQFGVPLDKDFVFSTTSARNNYLTDASTSGIAYSGMIVADLQTNKIYLLGTSGNPSVRAWLEVGAETVDDLFANSGIMVKTGNNTFASRGLDSGSNIEITNASGLAANPVISLSTSVTGLSNLTSTSGVFSNKLAVSGSLTLNGRDITTSLEATQNTNTANFNLSVGSVTDVGSNGGPSYYGTYDQGGNVREIINLPNYSGGYVVRGGNFASLQSDDSLNKSKRSINLTPSGYGPGLGFRLSSRENIGKTYLLNLSAGTGIAISGSVVHNFQIGDPLKFASDDGLPTVISSGVTYYVVGTGSTTFSVASGTGLSPISFLDTNNKTSAYSAYDYGSFVRVEDSGNANDTNSGQNGAVNYNYRIGKFEVTNDEYVEFLNAVARDDHDAGSAYYNSSIDRPLYEPMMETEAPNNGISRNASFPDYYYASLRGMNKKPVVFINYFDAVNYCNWLHNGKPTSTRYKACQISTDANTGETSVFLRGHDFIQDDLVTFSSNDGKTFPGTLKNNTVYRISYANQLGFVIKTIQGNNVTFTDDGAPGSYYVRKFFDKNTYLNSGSYTLTLGQNSAPDKEVSARYWIPTENEWYKAAYHDPAKSGVGSPGYWNYPTRSDTMPTPVSADSNGNGSYNGAGTIPSHNHSSYDISDFVDRIGGILVNGSGTQPIYDSSSSTIVVNVTGIPLSTVKDVTATATEVNYLDLSTGAGTAEASKALVLNSNKSITGITNISSTTGNINYISGITGVFGASNNTDNASTLVVGNTNVSLSGHKHYYDATNKRFDDIPGFCSGVADCVDTALSASTGIQFNYSSNSVSISLSGQALALHNLSNNGIIVRSGDAVIASRTITSGNNINISNGDGVAANPTISLSSSLTGLIDLTVGQIKIDGSTISTTGNNDSITLAPNGTGDVNIDADTLRVGDVGASATLTTNGTGNLLINTNGGTNSSSVTINQGTNGNIDVGLNGTGSFNVGKVNIGGATGSVINNTSIGYTTASSGKFTLVEVDNTKIDNDKIYLSDVPRIDLNSTETAINNPEGNVNFRVAGSGSSATNLLFVDATNNRVGIGTNSPSSLFSVSGAVNFNSTITAPNIGASTSSDSLVTLDNGLLKTRTVDSRVWGTSSLVDGNGSAGGIPYWSDSNSLTQSSNLFWDSGNSRLGIGTNSPSYVLDVRGNSYISGNLIVGNNLTISGTTVVANVDTMTVKDPIINLGLTQGNTIADTDYDRGLSLSLGSTLTAFMGWDTSESEFVMLSSGVPGTASGTYSPGTYGNLRVGRLNANSGLTSSGIFSVQASGASSTSGFAVFTSSPTGTSQSLLYRTVSEVRSDLGTSSNTSSTLVLRDGNGDFSARNITATGFIGDGSSVTGVNAYALNVYSNSLTNTVNSLVMVTGTGTGNLRPFIDSGLKFNANTNSLILENISGTLSTIFNSTTYNSVFSATSISGLAAFGSNKESYLLNFIIDGGTP